MKSPIEIGTRFADYRIEGYLGSGGMAVVYLAKHLRLGRLVYALGCVLYECLAGRPPFRRDTAAGVMYEHLYGQPPQLSEIRPELPQGFDDVLARAMAKSPVDRYATATQLTSAASHALSGEFPVVDAGHTLALTEPLRALPSDLVDPKRGRRLPAAGLQF